MIPPIRAIVIEYEGPSLPAAWLCIRPGWYRARLGTPLPAGALRWPEPTRPATPLERAWAWAVVDTGDDVSADIAVLGAGRASKPSPARTDRGRAIVALGGRVPVAPSWCWHAPVSVRPADLACADHAALPVDVTLAEVLPMGSLSGRAGCGFARGVAGYRVTMPGHGFARYDEALSAGVAWMRGVVGLYCYERTVRSGGTTDWWARPLPEPGAHQLRLVGADPVDVPLAGPLDALVLPCIDRTILSADAVQAVSRRPQFAALCRSDARALVRAGRADRQDVPEAVDAARALGTAMYWWWPTHVARDPRVPLALGVPVALHDSAWAGFDEARATMISVRRACLA